MLDYARLRAIEALSSAGWVVLVTNGPAGLLASMFPCEAVELALYLPVPKTSDHLFNLEHDSTVALVTAEWELKGKAAVISPRANLKLKFIHQPVMEWSELVRIEPNQLQFRRKDGWGNLETIDLHGFGVP
jgi:hypothetical protein